LLLEMLFLGLLQGMLEWLPISSKGNLVLVMFYFLGIDAENAFSLSILVHVGTLLSAVIYFRREIMEIWNSLKGPKSHIQGYRLLVFLVAATIATGLVGFPLFLVTRAATVFETGLIVITGAALIFTGLMERKGEKSAGRREESDLRLSDGVIVGLAQALSAVLGVSRSGITTTALLLRGFQAREALRISFLLSIPAVLSVEMALGILQGLPHLEVQPLIMAVVGAFVSSIVMMRTLIRLTEKIRFSRVCIVLGVISLIPLVAHL